MAESDRTELDQLIIEIYFKKKKTFYVSYPMPQKK